MNRFIGLVCGLVMTAYSWSSSSAAERTVTVIAVEESPGNSKVLQPKRRANVEIETEDGRMISNFTDSNGVAVIRFPESRTFVVTVLFGTSLFRSTNRLSGGVDQVVSVYNGSEPARAAPEGAEALAYAIARIAESAPRGIPAEVKQEFGDAGIISELKKARAADELSADEMKRCLTDLEAIRRAPELKTTQSDCCVGSATSRQGLKRRLFRRD